MRKRKRAAHRNGKQPHDPIAAAVRPTLAAAERARVLAPTSRVPRGPVGPERLPWPREDELPPILLAEAARLAALRLLTQQVEDQATRALDVVRVEIAKASPTDRRDRIAHLHALRAQWDERIQVARARERACERAIHDRRIAAWRFPQQPDVYTVVGVDRPAAPPPPEPEPPKPAPQRPGPPDAGDLIEKLSRTL